MTVFELIGELSRLDPNATVMTVKDRLHSATTLHSPSVSWEPLESSEAYGGAIIGEDEGSLIVVID